MGGNSSQLDSTQADTRAPFVSQLAFVWDISAWLTSELSVRGGFLCPDLVTELQRMARGRAFLDHLLLLLRQFILTLYPRASDSLHTHADMTKQMDKRGPMLVNWALQSVESLSD